MRPHVGMDISTRRDFWVALTASLQAVSVDFPDADIVLAGDTNLYLAEVMPGGRERSAESDLCDMVRNLCDRLNLRIANTPALPTHRSGSVVDLVLTSRNFVLSDVTVRDGDLCLCSPGSCFPAINSDHCLITFSVEKAPPSNQIPQAQWPKVRDWLGVRHCACDGLDAWRREVLAFRAGECPISAAERRAVLDVLYGSLVAILWEASGASSPNHNMRSRQPTW